VIALHQVQPKEMLSSNPNVIDRRIQRIQMYSAARCVQSIKRKVLVQRKKAVEVSSEHGSVSRVGK
jgi:hypothetical protein